MDFGAGACLVVGRQTFLDVGGFDPAYDPAYYEDADLCLKLRAGHGLRTLFVPEVRVIHARFASGGVDSARVLYERHRKVFVDRWGEYLRGTRPPRLWPPHPALLLAARDAAADGRVLMLGGESEALQAAVGRFPWVRFTIVPATDPEEAEPWLRAGVEALPASAEALLVERAGHYDVVVAGAAWSDAIRLHQPQALHLTDPAALEAALEAVGISDVTLDWPPSSADL